MNNRLRNRGIFLTILFAIGFIFVLMPAARAQDTDTIYFFYEQGCPHCAKVEAYFEDEGLYNSYPIKKKEIYFNRDNAILFNNILNELGVPVSNRVVPTVVMGDIILAGDTPIVQNFKVAADTFLKKISDEEKSAVRNEKKPNLTIAVVIAGSLVDAINPCAFAVLIILMTAILAAGNAKKALAAGLAFSASIFVSYFLMGLGLYKALSLGTASGWFFQAVGWAAIVLGLFNLKDYFWYGKGFLMEVPLGWRPRLKNLIRSVTNPGGAFVVGFLVSLFLLPCTSGPYVVILGMLAKNPLNTQAIAYLLLYNLIFVLPMILISWAVYKGFNPAKAEEMRLKRLRILHLIAGIIMLAMGVVILAGWL